MVARTNLEADSHCEATTTNSPTAGTFLWTSLNAGSSEVDGFAWKMRTA